MNLQRIRATAAIDGGGAVLQHDIVVIRACVDNQPPAAAFQRDAVVAVAGVENPIFVQNLRQLDIDGIGQRPVIRIRQRGEVESGILVRRQKPCEVDIAAIDIGFFISVDCAVDDGRCAGGDVIHVAADVEDAVDFNLFKVFLRGHRQARKRAGQIHVGIVIDIAFKADGHAPEVGVGFLQLRKVGFDSAVGIKNGQLVAVPCIAEAECARDDFFHNARNGDSGFRSHGGLRAVINGARYHLLDSTRKSECVFVATIGQLVRVVSFRRDCAAQFDNRGEYIPEGG